MSNKPYGQLAIITMKSFEDMGNKIDLRIIERRKSNHGFNHIQEDLPASYQISIRETRFANGEGKVKLAETIRGKDVYILSDISNFSVTYDFFGTPHNMGPDEHFADIKRVLSAIGGKARRITLIMPLLYQSRQHRRKGRESLDCALALQELSHLGIDDLITFDVHDPNIQNAIPLVSFENIYPTYDIIKSFILEEPDVAKDKENFLVISPDTGAMDRAIYYSTVLDVNVGTFYKRRDINVVVNGKNPIVKHEYMGPDLKGKSVLIVDDMIASGESMLHIIEELKNQGANKIYCAATFAWFTDGTAKFDKYYEQGFLKKVFTTNLSYIREEVTSTEWLHVSDLSNFIAKIIDYLNYDRSLATLFDATIGIKKLLEESK